MQKRFKDPLDVLINNAGCMINKRILTQDGFEKNFATNTLGTHILTENLIPNLRKANSNEKSRVVTVSSGEDLNNFFSKTLYIFDFSQSLGGESLYNVEF